ncbi:MAG: hypothetical protein K6B69_08140 [Lachnospiraceae bacterium]|nr:hypothetical protein [Lachnospiraceae bacterium]
MNDFEKASCPHCGAPAISRICAYCGSDTGLTHDEAVAQLDYPVLDYQDVTHDYSMGIWNIFVSGLFILMGLVFPFIGLLLVIYGIYVLFKHSIIAPIRDFGVRKSGKECIGLVFTYFDSEQAVTKEQKYANKQTLALLIHTDAGNRLILCKTGKIYKRYHENTHIKLKIHGNKYIVYGEKEEIVPV